MTAYETIAVVLSSIARIRFGNSWSILYEHKGSCYSSTSMYINDCGARVI